MAQFYAFTKENVDSAPLSHGVYMLYHGTELTYIGRATGDGVTIRSRLQSHYAGNEGPCTKTATQYQREILDAAAAKAREVQLLEWHKKAYGRLPRCNDRIG